MVRASPMAAMRLRVGGMLPESRGASSRRSNWRADGTQVDFFTLKGLVEDLLESIGARGTVFQPVSRQPFVAGTAAEVCLRDKTSIGFIGEIDPKVVEFERVPFRVFAFELDLEALEDAFRRCRSTTSFCASRRLPVILRSSSRLRCPYSDLVDAIRSTAGAWLESIRLVDQYQGSQVPPGHQSLAFHMVFRDSERTLTAEEVAETMDRIIGGLERPVQGRAARVGFVITFPWTCSQPLRCFQSMSLKKSTAADFKPATALVPISSAVPTASRPAPSTLGPFGRHPGFPTVHSPVQRASDKASSRAGAGETNWPGQSAD